MSRYVKGYAIDRRKVAEYLELVDDDDNCDKISNTILDAITFVRDRSVATGNKHTFAVGHPIDSKDTVHIISSAGLDALSRNLDELKRRVLEHPDYVKELAEIICSGQDVFEIVEWDDPLVSLGNTKLTVASNLGFC
ncbi:hypothetical protein GYMLUDRAFT_45690 [Collybiopsis luxurians FD-317 M1]|uniref:Uncharacterized protein n=1 Tax=Collybiopsis luxurians FD-317 M1 TaxID=944289 RepID=A0A0D0B3K9_9AGAR|nr:hypothetical protein GYMLUDRAFT_45690 [Collybiopsis luxurians FD-317 M1]